MLSKFGHHLKNNNLNILLNKDSNKQNLPRNNKLIKKLSMMHSKHGLLSKKAKKLNNNFKHNKGLKNSLQMIKSKCLSIKLLKFMPNIKLININKLKKLPL